MKIAIMGVRGIPAKGGGFETCAEQTAVRFAENHEVYVYCRKHKSNWKENTYKGVNLVKLGSLNTKHFDTLSHTLFSIVHLLFYTDIKVVHLYNSANAIFLPLLKIFGIKTAVSVDGLEWKRLKWNWMVRVYLRIAEWLCVIFADAIIADSSIVQNYYSKRYYKTPVYIPYGSQNDIMADSGLLAKFNLQPKRYFYFVGRLVPEKGVDKLISAYKKVKTDIPLVIIGGDPDHQEYITGLKDMADERVKFLGFVYGDEYHAINNNAYAYVTASMLEGTSPALVAAMGAGNCVLVNGIPENRETIADAGFHFRENDFDDLTNKMQILADNPELVEEYGNRAFLRVMTTYNWDSIADQYINLFRSLLEPEAKPAQERKRIHLRRKEEELPVVSGNSNRIKQEHLEESK
ncbi:MAG: glycosyltransferase [candidate division Zixibacteria bacterium]|nr:glycosyltransferase [candidate division Zixibacteria bacterium]